MRRFLAVLLTAVLSLMGTAMLISPSAAQAAPAQARPAQADTTAYTYWGFYTWNADQSSWSFMKVGPGDKSTRSSTDGSVYGFRYATVVKKPRFPRADGNFDTICGDRQHSDGTKRIAFVIDYGTDADAPEQADPPHARGVCAVVDSGFTVLQALQSVARARMGKSGLVCGIDGYPAKGCSTPVADATTPPPDQQVTLQITAPQDSADDPGSGFPIWGIVVAAVLVIILIAGTLVVRRQRA